MNLLSPSSVYAVIFYSLQFIFGIPGNLLIIIVYSKKKRKISTDVLIITQAIIDLIASLLAPINILKSVSDRFTTTVICRLALFGNNSLAFSSLFLAAAIAVDRFFFVCRPYGKKTTNPRAVTLAVACCVLGGSLTCTKLIFVEPYISSNGQKTCLVIDTYHILDTLEAWLKTSGFVLALVTSTVTYGKIYHTIRHQAKVHARLVGGASSLAHTTNSSRNAIPTGNADLRGPRVHVNHGIDSGVAQSVIVTSDTSHPENSNDIVSAREQSGPKQNFLQVDAPGVERNSSAQNTVPDPVHNISVLPKSPQTIDHAAVTAAKISPRPKISERGENRTTKMLMAVTVILLASWLPPIVFFHLRDSTQEIIERSVAAETLVYIGKRLPGFNHVINFFVYTLMNKRFRLDCKRLFKA